MSICSSLADAAWSKLCTWKVRSGSPWPFAFQVQLSLAAVALSLTLWAGSGTLTPYMGSGPHFVEPCDVPVNMDHATHAQAFALVDGQPRDVWKESVVLRRILYPVLAYPLFKAFGLMVGGFLSTVWMHVGALVAFCLFVRRRLGDGVALVVAWLLACYPGVSYWGGLPYGYAMIFPGSLLFTMVLWRLSDDDVRMPSAFVLGLLGGVICLGYDLLIIYGPAAMLVHWWRGRLVSLVPTALALALPTTAWLFLLSAWFDVPPGNDNTKIYATIAGSYLGDIDWDGWSRLVVELPATFASNFLYSNFIVLPLLTVIVLLLARSEHLRLLRVEKALLLGALTLFLFLNLAPPYPGKWQLRGVAFSRLYQPLFPVLVLLIARTAVAMSARRSAARKPVAVSLLLALVANLSIVYGPWLGLPHAQWAYWHFYAYRGGPKLAAVGEVHGRRPLGVCQEQ